MIELLILAMLAAVTTVVITLMLISIAIDCLIDLKQTLGRL